MDPFPDVGRFRLRRHTQPATRGQKVRVPRHRPGERFLKGPIPWRWLTKAARLPGKALHVAIALWFWAGIKRSAAVAFPISQLRLLGVSRYAAYRGLLALERVGLVSVCRHSGRRSLVTLLDAPSVDSTIEAPPD